MTDKDIPNMPQPLKELLWLMKQLSDSEGVKRERYRQKIINWKRAYPEYVNFVSAALMSVKRYGNEFEAILESLDGE